MKLMARHIAEHDDLFDQYDFGKSFDEMLSSLNQPRESYRKLFNFFKTLSLDNFHERVSLAELAFVTNGVTFTLKADEGGLEKIIPFDIVPRIIHALEWKVIEKGLKQRIRALNLFLTDIYHDQHIINDGILPKSILSNSLYCKEMQGVSIPGNIYTHIAGIDLIRDDQGTFRVLEDNLRCPSGVSYVLENREVLQRVLPEMFAEHAVRPVDEYPRHLLSCLSSLAVDVTNPTVVLLSPGIYNSAYFEHSFLAAKMGIHLVEGGDLLVYDHKVFMKTTSGLERVQVIYRRVDDEFLDPLTFRKDSLLGVAGLFEAYRRGNVVLANAIGNGVADDKATYAFVPQMIQYYLNEKPLLPNVPTYFMSDAEQRNFVFENIKDMIIKPTQGSGGYGMLLGHQTDEDQKNDYFKKVLRNPNGFIAQNIVNLSCHPTFMTEEGALQPRHVDLRPFVLTDVTGNIHVMPGGLSRVAMVKDSLVVNSSQGGGGKDTWVLADTKKNQGTKC